MSQQNIFDVVNSRLSLIEAGLITVDLAPLGLTFLKLAPLLVLLRLPIDLLLEENLLRTLFHDLLLDFALVGAFDLLFLVCDLLSALFLVCLLPLQELPRFAHVYKRHHP